MFDFKKKPAFSTKNFISVMTFQLILGPHLKPRKVMPVGVSFRAL